jgi:hypothetical protein
MTRRSAYCCCESHLQGKGGGHARCSLDIDELLVLVLELAAVVEAALAREEASGCEPTAPTTLE